MNNTQDFKIKIKWGTEKEVEKTYAFKNENDLNMFLKGVDESNGWLNYEVIENE